MFKDKVDTYLRRAGYTLMKKCWTLLDSNLVNPVAQLTLPSPTPVLFLPIDGCAI